MIRNLAVIVPAADEQDRIAACLRAINEARTRLLESEFAIDRVDVIVVLDACADETPEVVARFSVAEHVHVVTSGARCVGTARQLGALKAMASRVPTERLWLANTDADSAVPPYWLIGMVAAANAGNQLVLGTVMPDSEISPVLRAAWLAPHQLTEDHPHVHGANLGIRADTYNELGGWNPALARDEDVDLARRAAASRDIRVLRTATIPVLTSARTVGRAPNGFSSYMRHLTES